MGLSMWLLKTRDVLLYTILIFCFTSVPLRDCLEFTIDLFLVNYKGFFLYTT